MRIFIAFMYLLLMMNSSAFAMKRWFGCGCKQEVQEPEDRDAPPVSDKHHNKKADNAVTRDAVGAVNDWTLEEIVDVIVKFRLSLSLHPALIKEQDPLEVLYNWYELRISPGKHCLRGCTCNHVYQLRCCGQQSVIPLYFCRHCAKEMCNKYPRVCPFCGGKRCFDKTPIDVENDIVVQDDADLYPEQASSPPGMDDGYDTPHLNDARAIPETRRRVEGSLKGVRRCLNGCSGSTVFRLACCKAAKQSRDVYYCQECINTLLKNFCECPWCQGCLEQEIIPVDSDIGDDLVLSEDACSDQQN